MGEWPKDEYATHPCHRNDGGELSYVKTNYGSLGSGGSDEEWYCTVHGTHYFQLPD